MITREPTKETVEEWRIVWLQCKDKLTPNRKSGNELLNYLQHKYVLTEICEKELADVVSDNIIMNACHAEKLPAGTSPVPRTFFLENVENGKILYKDENKELVDICACDGKIFIGIDTVTGFFTVEGSIMLYDELLAFRGLDEQDIKNFVCVSEYIAALKKFD